MAKKELRVAITLMTRKPHKFDWWLRYHRSLGISHVFVHVEDTPELVPMLASDEFADFVTVTTGNDNSLDPLNPHASDNYYTLMQRQERQVLFLIAPNTTQMDVDIPISLLLADKLILIALQSKEETLPVSREPLHLLLWLLVSLPF